MTEKKIYLKPESQTVSFCPEGAVMTNSVLKNGSASGEDINFGDEFNPWA